DVLLHCVLEQPSRVRRKLDTLECGSQRCCRSVHADSVPRRTRRKRRRRQRFCLNRAMAAPAELRVGDETYSIYRLDALQAKWDVARHPYTLRILLENVLRNGTDEEVEAVAGWIADAEPSHEISFAPARVLLQDFTGVPCVVDLAAMRDAMRNQNG